MENQLYEVQQETAPQTPEKKGWWGALKVWEKIVTIVLALVVLFAFYIALDANKYQATVHVIEGEGKVGINPTTERLDFGDLSRGTSAVRRVTVTNGTAMPMYVMVWKTGKVSELMDENKNYFTLAPGNEERLEFTIYMPASAQIGATLDGRVYLLKIPTFGL
ncbi:MAG: hypothetical protein AAB581_00625 [Patescibacteria group bacterium]